MRRFSANLGFLWADRPLPDAIRAAHAAGFDAVECHWPYETPAKDVAAALHETGLPMLGLNTRRGDVAAGDNGLCALPGREAEARKSIEEAVHYACTVDAQAVHAMAGVTRDPAAADVLITNLRFAAELAGETGRTILIEPLNPNDAPGYFYHTVAEAVAIIEAVGAPNVKLMFDCYHVGRTEGDVITRLGRVWDHVGHIQFASVPSRGTPDIGELRYDVVFDAIARLGWEQPLGAEYKPVGATDDSLSWMEGLR